MELAYLSPHCDCDPTIDESSSTAAARTTPFISFRALTQPEVELHFNSLACVCVCLSKKVGRDDDFICHVVVDILKGCLH